MYWDYRIAEHLHQARLWKEFSRHGTTSEHITVSDLLLLTPLSLSADSSLYHPHSSIYGLFPSTSSNFFCMCAIRLTMLRLVRMYLSVSCLWTCWTSGPTTTSSSRWVISGITADRRSRSLTATKKKTVQTQNDNLSVCQWLCIYFFSHFVVFSSFH